MRNSKVLYVGDNLTLALPDNGLYRVEADIPRNLSSVSLSFKDVNLSSNLSAYFLFSLLGLLLANQCKEKKRFFRFFLFLIITLPILSSYIQIKLYPTLLSWLPNLNILLEALG